MFRRVDIKEGAWDAEQAEQMLGRRALVGLTFTDSQGRILERTQRYGRIVVVDPERGIAIAIVGYGRRWDGEQLWLPPDLTVFSEASPGDYELKATGEIVSDLDLVATWELRAPSPAEDTPARAKARSDDALRLGFWG